MVDVTIGSQTYPSYASVEQADEYFNAAQHGAAWRAITDDDDKARALVTATRILDRQRWKGTKTAEDQDLAWPRDGVDCPGAEDGVIPNDIVTATMELALSLIEGSEVQTSQNTAQKIQRLKAGSVEIAYFRGAEGIATRFPQIIMELVRCYLDGYGSNLGLGVNSTGTDGCSITNNDFGYTEGI